MTKEGCSSQIDLCTVGTVMSNEPALSGATWLFTAHGFSNSTGRLIFLTGIGRQGGGFNSHVRGELCVNE